MHSIISPKKKGGGGWGGGGEEREKREKKKERKKWIELWMLFISLQCAANCDSYSLREKIDIHYSVH